MADVPDRGDLRKGRFAEPKIQFPEPTSPKRVSILGCAWTNCGDRQLYWAVFALHGGHRRPGTSPYGCGGSMRRAVGRSVARAVVSIKIRYRPAGATARSAAIGDKRPWRPLMRYVMAICAMLAVATPTAAQSTYVGGSVVFDIARFDKTEFDDEDLPRVTPARSVDGEATGFNLRIGRALGERWGVEFEFARSGEIENSESYGVPFLMEFLPPGLSILPIADSQYEIETEQRYTNYGALAWIRQDLSDRVDLTYLGGVAFNRNDVDQDVRITDTRLAQWMTVIPDMSVTEYSIAPVVGIDAGFKLGEAAAITAGLRAQGATGGGRTGLLLRPNVGVRWTF
jgi:opacity protein-like surface antigen